MRRTSSTIVPTLEVSRQINDTAYETVKVVADNIETIKQVSEALNDDAFGIAADNVVVIQTVAGIADQVVAVANGMLDISAILPHIAAIQTLASNIAALQAIASNVDKIVDVHSMLDAVIDVAADLELVDSKIASVADNMDAIVVTASSNDNIDIVATYIQNVNTVHSNLDKIATVVEDRFKIRTVADNMIPVIWLFQNQDKLVGFNSANINTVAQNIEAIVSVDTNLDAVVAVSEIVQDVSEVANLSEDVHVVASNITSVVTTSNNIGSVSIVGNDLSLAGYSNLQDLGSISDPVTQEPSGYSAIDTVVTNIDDVNTVAANIAEVVAVGQVTTELEVVYANLGEILLADDNAAIATSKAGEAAVSANNALTSEGLAHKWANEAEDVPVQGTIGVDDEYSAYHWAKKAEAAAGGNITLDSLYNVDAATPLDKQVLRYDEAGAVDAKWVVDTIDKAYVGLDQVDNTSDATKWAATATLTNKTIDGISNTIGADHIHYKVRNNTGSAIAKGTVVKAAGSQPGTDYILIEPTTSTQDVGIGVVHSTIDGTTGWVGLVVNTGEITGVNTSAWSIGTILYTSSGGTWTTTKPTSGYYQASAYVLRSHSSQGTLLVEFSEPKMTINKIVEDITVIDCGSIA